MNQHSSLFVLVYLLEPSHTLNGTYSSPSLPKDAWGTTPVPKKNAIPP